MGDQDSIKVSNTGKVFMTKNLNLKLGTVSDTNDSTAAYVNAPLVHKDMSLVGGCVFDHKQIKNWVKDPNQFKGNFSFKNCIFGCDNKGELFVKEGKDIATLKAADLKWAFQNGPVLLKEGANNHNRNGTHRCYRTGIGNTKNNELVVIASKKPVNLYEFAELFRLQGCKNAVYLDGEKTKGDNDYVGYKLGTDEDKMKAGRPILMFSK